MPRQQLMVEGGTSSMVLLHCSLPVTLARCTCTVYG